MNLRNAYNNLTNEELIRIVDLPDAYTAEAQDVAMEILNSRNLLKASKEELARKLWVNYCKAHFRKIVNDSLKLNSQILDQEEINRIMTDAYQFYKERQELFEIDLTKYWGAVF